MINVYRFLVQCHQDVYYTMLKSRNIHNTTYLEKYIPYDVVNAFCISVYCGSYPILGMNVKNTTVFSHKSGYHLIFDIVTIAVNLKVTKCPEILGMETGFTIRQYDRYKLCFNIAGHFCSAIATIITSLHVWGHIWIESRLH